ncbi:hypothetical protein ElyMa_004606100 [Elysia marginata]|uniref:Uncharacterized protein n=1 Tax=Elysia marginata TaxID=1093978 RepID=A0AAV4HWW3_9GAST|nr:hypothetical protein ElyMa_004606100 [Elysia marginata]
MLKKIVKKNCQPPPPQPTNGQPLPLLENSNGWPQPTQPPTQPNNGQTQPDNHQTILQLNNHCPSQPMTDHNHRWS